MLQDSISSAGTIIPDMASEPISLHAERAHLLFRADTISRTHRDRDSPTLHHNSSIQNMISFYGQKYIKQT